MSNMLDAMSFYDRQKGEKVEELKETLQSIDSTLKRIEIILHSFEKESPADFAEAIHDTLREYALSSQ